ncbi:MAG TPA: hypothetical protein PKY01_04500 [Candidatus Hydrogenedentes bacterium]|nr:hypothetical protein [Candidatus Hydrogenedentota bacterium]
MIRFCLALVAVLPFRAFAQEPYRIAVLDEPSLPVEGCATPPQTFEAALAAADIVVSRLSAEQLSDPAIFNGDAFDLLIVPTGASFPVSGKHALLSFLQKGGDLLTTGGYAFDRLWLKEDGQWRAALQRWEEERDKARDPQYSMAPNGGFENGSDGWWDADPAASAVVTDEKVSGNASGRVNNEVAEMSNTWTCSLPVEPGTTYLIGGCLKARDIKGSGFAYMAVYQHDANGALVTFVDFVQLRESADWKRYETQVPIAPNAANVLFHGGLFRASGTAWLDDVTCAQLPTEDIINAHYGDPRDALRLEPLQLALFSPDQPIRGDSLVASPGSPLLADWRSEGPVAGFEATAQLRASARWIPFVEARGQAGGFQGAAGAFVHHYAGPFAGSNWALFGVTSRDIFEGESGAQLARATIARLRCGVFVESVKTSAPIYERGAAADIVVHVDNTSPEPRSVDITLELLGLPKNAGPAHVTSLSQPAEMPGQSEQTFQFTFQIPENAPDFIQAASNVKHGSVLADRAVSGFCVRDGGVVAAGPRIHYAGNVLIVQKPDMAEQRVCLFGTDTYGSMFSSPNCSPWTWFQDLQMMRDHGLHMFENLGFFPPDFRLTDAQWEQQEALIQLAQRFGLVYMAGILIGRDVAISDEELGQSAELCRAFAARFKDVPGLIYYLNGDFQLRIKDLPDLQRLWNEFLARRYVTDEALRQAWSAAPPEAPLGQLPLRHVAAQAWYDVRARDFTEFQTTLMTRWIETLCSAIRQEDSEHPITSEYYQRPIEGIDLRLTLGSMDMSNFGYFDVPRADISRLMATIKWNDMRFAGKTVNIGEFGVKTHDAWTVERGGAGYHIRRAPEDMDRLFWWAGHAAYAMGVTKIQNWCWSDDPDSVFPWGMAWNNPLRPKSALRLYKALSGIGEYVSMDRPAAETIFVMPDTWRLGAPAGLAHTSLMNALECLLATSIPFDVANEAELARVAERRPRLAILPLAYALPDIAVEQLLRIAEDGACVYLSGDPSITPGGQRDPARLERLPGVRFEREIITSAGLPAAECTAVEATPVENANGIPAFRRAVGNGSIIWTPDPWESFPQRDLFVGEPELTTSPDTNFYLMLPNLAGLEPPARIEASQGVWRVIATPCGDNHLVAIFPRTPVGQPTVVKVTAFGHTFEFGTQPFAGETLPAIVVLHDGVPIAATGTDYLDIDSRRVAQAPGPWCTGL